MKIGIYNRYFSTMGGGEKYTGVLASYLSRKHTVEIITHEKFDKKKLEDNLALDLSKVNVVLLPPSSEKEDEEYSKEYDLFVNCTYFSTAEGLAKKNIVILYFPYYWNNIFPAWTKWIFMMSFKPFYSEGFLSKTVRKIPLIEKVLRRIEPKWQDQEKFFLRRNYIDKYDQAITISEYSQKWTKHFYDIDVPILYPPIDTEIFKPLKKKKIIMSVGRFFVSNHNKKQLQMIKAFKKMYDQNPELKEYEYHLCGGTHREKIHLDYLELCKKEAKGYPIYFHENILFPDLKNLYGEASIFWHAAGFSEDPNRFPDRFEHFGITTVEAMSAGVVPIVINMAGQKETVEEGKTGFLWDTEEELISKTVMVANDDKLRENISKEAVKASKKFSRAKFHERIGQLFGKYINA